MVDCLPCALSNHESCWLPGSEGLCCCPEDFESSGVEAHGMADGSSRERLEAALMADPDDGKRERGGQIKDADNVSDRESTGRKRAEKLAPIYEGMPCEWRGLLLAGGGFVPIVGCRNGVAVNRHHGPNKSTLANWTGNLHRICAQCHNRWHTLNDEYYSDERPAGNYYLPLSPLGIAEHNGYVPADAEALAYSEVAWAASEAKQFLLENKLTNIDKLKPLTGPDFAGILEPMN